jgi:hypothetical protein
VVTSVSEETAVIRMEAVGSCETLVKTYKIMLCPHAEDHIASPHTCEYLRSHQMRKINVSTHSPFCSLNSYVK